MRTSVRFCGAVGLSAASLLAIAAPAFADSSHNTTGVGILDGDNLNVLPIQVCGKDSNLVGVVTLDDVLDAHRNSPEAANCPNAPVVDHGAGTF